MHEEPDIDLTLPEVTDDDKALIENSGYSNEHRVRKASTIERDTLAPTSNEEFLPQSKSVPLNIVPPTVKPRTNFKRQVDRVVMARSMIILPDSKTNRLPYDDSPQVMVKMSNL